MQKVFPGQPEHGNQLLVDVDFRYQTFAFAQIIFKFDQQVGKEFYIIEVGPFDFLDVAIFHDVIIDSNNQV